MIIKYSEYVLKKPYEMSIQVQPRPKTPILHIILIVICSSTHGKKQIRQLGHLAGIAYKKLHILYEKYIIKNHIIIIAISMILFIVFLLNIFFCDLSPQLNEHNFVIILVNPDITLNQHQIIA